MTDWVAIKEWSLRHGITPGAAAELALILREPEVVDLGVVTHVCICGSHQWKVVVSFDDYEIATYSTEMYCLSCGAKAKSPTALDRPGGPA